MSKKKRKCLRANNKMTDLLAEEEEVIWWKGFPHEIVGFKSLEGNLFVDWSTVCKWIGIKPTKMSLMKHPPNILIHHETGNVIETNSAWGLARPMIPLNDLVKSVTDAINRKRKHIEYKKELLQKIGLAHIVQPQLDIEHKCLGTLIHSCPFSISCNYRLGKYKIDAYIPDLRLAIEIDEHNHKGYNADQEKSREREIRNSGMVLLRFNPHQHKNNPAEALISEVWKKTLSPDMKAFVRQTH